MHRIPISQLQATLSAILAKLGFAKERAFHCAQLFAETTCDGVYTHGVNRFARFVATIQNGCVDVLATPEQISAFGALERWDGHRGPGNLNAFACMQRAIGLSHQHGIGYVALRNTNHWMRGGTYGWQAADAGVIGICWTNTMPNLPPWGGVDPCLGNNPLIFAVPRKGGHIVLDIAMSQFSYGALASYRKQGRSLPVEGGFDLEGNLTRDPAAVEASQRPLPIGYWKGAGLALVLDLIAAMTSLGKAAHQIPADPLLETEISQVFLAIHPAALGDKEQLGSIADEIIANFHQCTPSDPKHPVRYPGEQVLRIREENTRLGIPVEEDVWQQITAML